MALGADGRAMIDCPVDLHEVVAWLPFEFCSLGCVKQFVEMQPEERFV